MMEQELNITETDWGLHVVTNEGDLLDGLNHLSRIKYIFDICKEMGKNKIRINGTATTRRVSTLKLMEGVVLMRHIGGPGFRIAIFAPDLVNNEDSRIVENVAHNRGIFIQYFPDEEEAMKWLLKRRT